MTDLLDAVIVGGGPAGLAAALTLGRARRPTLLVDGGEPRNAPADHMHNVLGHDGLPPAELRSRGRAELAGYPTVTVEDDDVLSAERLDDGTFSVVRARGGAVRARRLVLASGVVDATDRVPGMAELWGRSVLHCPYCHGYEVRDRALGVLGATGHHAFIATLLTRYSDDVVLFTDGDEAPEPDALERAGVRAVTSTSSWAAP